MTHDTNADGQISAMMNNLKAAKSTDGDGAKRAQKNAKQSQRENETKADYQERANYRVYCGDCDMEMHRINETDTIRKIQKGLDDFIHCEKCGSSDVNCEEK